MSLTNGIWSDRLRVCGLWGKPTLLFCSAAAAVVSFVNPVLRCDQRWCNLQLGCITSASRDGGLKTTHVGQGSSSKLVRCCRQRSVSNQETGFQTGRDFRAHWWCCYCWQYRHWKSVKGDGTDIYWYRQRDKPNHLRLLRMTSTKCALCYSQTLHIRCFVKMSTTSEAAHHNSLIFQYNVIRTSLQLRDKPSRLHSYSVLLTKICFLRYGHPTVFKLYRMETMSPIHNTYFAHHSYMFRLPQRSHHQAVQRIIKRN